MLCVALLPVLHPVPPQALPPLRGPPPRRARVTTRRNLRKSDYYRISMEVRLPFMGYVPLSSFSHNRKWHYQHSHYIILLKRNGPLRHWRKHHQQLHAFLDSPSKPAMDRVFNHWYICSSSSILFTRKKVQMGQHLLA